MAAHGAQQRVYVLTLPAVKWGIAELKGPRVHPFFVAYLHLRQIALETGRDTGLTPVWDRLGEYLAVSGGAPGFPYYRPMWNTKVNDPRRYWLNSNLAGSFAPSSLRSGPTQNVIQVADGEYSLVPDHSRLAKEHLLYGGTVSAIALAAYFYRDFGFVTSDDEPPEAGELQDVLSRDFGFDSNDFQEIFDNVVPGTDVVADWFVDIENEPVGVI